LVNLWFRLLELSHNLFPLVAVEVLNLVTKSYNTPLNRTDLSTFK
jgi:hypothetical protein